MSDEFTYLTLKDEVVEANTNLRQLELPRSVTIFDVDQKEKLTDLNALPLLNDKPYAYLNPENGDVERGYNSYKFITDQYGGIESNYVMITDSKGGRHPIQYSESVGQQLLAVNCPSGIVTIREETMYGDYVEYQAVYIAPGDNQTELALTYKEGAENKTVVYKRGNADNVISVEAFSILGLRDPLDPYAFVVLKHNQKEEVYTAKDNINITWSDPGEYSLTCKNRLGYSYTLTITVIETEENKASVQSTPIITIQPSFTPEPVVTDVPVTEEPVFVEEEVTEQPQNVLISDQDEEAGSLVVPDSLKTTEQDQKSESGSSVIIGIIIAVLAVIAAAGVFIYRRGKLYSHMTNMIKQKV